MAEKQIRKTRLYDRGQTIVLNNSESPRRQGSNRHMIFSLIEDGMTVGEFLQLTTEYKGGTKDLQILEESGHVTILPLDQAEVPRPLVA